MHLVPEHLPLMRQTTTGPIIVHTVWETDRLPSRWAPLLNSSEGVIVPTEWNRELFAASGVSVPIEVIPHVACEPLPGDRGEALAIPDDVFVFYMISRWDERKIPALAIQAFLEAFTADDPVALVVKTGQLAEVRPPDQWGRSSPRFLTTDWQIARLLRRHPRPPRIQLIVDDWDDSRIAGLHARGDCYLALTHGEGWGIGGADACVYGNPVIATGWSGQLDYLAGSDTLVDYDLMAVSHLAGASYEPGQLWAQPRLEHAVELLRRVAADPGAARAAAEPLRERAVARFRGEVVAKRFIAAMARLGVLGSSA
jgi:glycosyltransferase involved in cell wall biosynthesis